MVVHVGGCRFGILGVLRGVWGDVWPKVCTYHESMCPCNGQQEGGEPVGGELGWG